MSHSVVTTQWAGISGSPGWTKLRFAGQSTPATASVLGGRVRTFFNAIASLLPADAILSVQTLVQQYSLDELVGEVSMDTPPAQVSGTSPSAYAGASGAVVNWLTGAFVDGHRVRGRTFLVPLTASALDTSGSLASAALTTLGNAANALVNGTPGMIILRGIGTEGVSEVLVTSASIPDRAAVLRSRRD